MQKKKVVIVGAGFAGVRTALDLARKNADLEIILINREHHFQYYPTLYKVVTGKSPLEVCIPLSEIFSGTEVRIENDTIINVRLEAKVAVAESGSEYPYDFLVLALGSETVFFGVPGLDTLSFTFKSIDQALRLKRHLHMLFDSHQTLDQDELMAKLQFVVVGGGPTGVELAGELALYLKELARRHDIPRKFVTLDIIELAPRLLPVLPEDVSKKITRRLDRLGVNILLGKNVLEETPAGVRLKDMTLASKTIIWTAGVKPHHVYKEIQGFELAKNGRVMVNEYLEAQGNENVFIVGDAADTPYAGLAQTALYDGHYVARVISRRLFGRSVHPYRPRKNSYDIPVGHGWAALVVGKIKIYGTVAWLMRELIDLKFFMSILPWGKALRAFQSGKRLCESCPTCDVFEGK